MSEETYQFDTLAVQSGQQCDPATGASATPIYQTVAYGLQSAERAARLFDLEETGYVYSRLHNPTVAAFEKRIADLEGGVAAVATATGQAAELITILNLCQAGDEIVSGNALYGGTFSFFKYQLPRMGITTHFVDPSDPENFRRALTPKTKLLYAEALGNPRLFTLDIAAVADIAHARGLPLVIDNTMLTPALLRPFDWGADLVIQSATKFVSGNGTAMGGAVIEKGGFDWGNGNFPLFTTPDPSYHGLVYAELPEPMRGMAFSVRARTQLMRDLGPVLAPQNAFLLLNGLQTLPLRVARHSESALTVARWLQEHPKVAWVNYPALPDHPAHKLAQKYHPNGGGAMLGFGAKGGYEAGRAFINRIKLISHQANFGDARSLAIHPASTTHRQLTPEQQRAAGITEDFIRLSVGLEDPQDILADIEQALA